MGAMSRRKGCRGENEIAAIIRDLTGWDIKRKVRQREGESDLEGVEGWCIEVKRHKTATRAEIREWWEQAERQAIKEFALPVLFYRKDRDDWRAVWQLYPDRIAFAVVSEPIQNSYVWTVDGSVDAWCDVARGMMRLGQ